MLHVKPMELTYNKWLSNECNKNYFNAQQVITNL